jgi:CRP/FNR family transcriptional regulator, cyclic AMP receptor protein
MSIGPSKLSAVPIAESNLPCLGHLKKLLYCKTVRVVPPQHVIFYQGESPHTVCLICNGLVKLTRTESDGNPVIVGLRKTGWLLAAAPLLGENYASTAETVTRSKLCFVPLETFRHAMETDSQFSLWVTMIFSKEVYSSVLSISERSCLSGKQRLKKFLWEIVQNLNTGNTDKAVKLPIPLKHWEMAQLLAFTPQHLSRLIRQMEKEGIILRKNGWLVLSEPKRLWHPE